MQSISQYDSYRKAINIGLAAVVGIAFVGYFVGTRPPPSPTPRTDAAKGASSAEAIPGQTYSELRWRRYGPSSKVSSNLDDLRKGLPSVMDTVVQSPEQKQEALSQRAERRAYDGAPPTVPHVVDEQNSFGCIACHGTGMVVKGRVARVMSHPPYASCTQCHVPGLERWPGVDKAVENTFAGLASPSAGPRAWEGAPPTIPHRVQMRENCASCHGVAGRPGMRTTHPNRPNCLQCHAMNETLEVTGRP